MSDPRCARIAAIICTRNRASLLRGVLASLVHQALDRSAYEIIVVDDGSTDDTRQVSAEFISQASLIYVHQRHGGLASAKNLGLFSTRAPLVLFLDDDDVASPTLLEQHVKTHEQYADDRYAVLGYTGLDSTLVNDPLMHFVTEVGCFLFSYPMLRDGQILDYSCFWGGRTSCKRAFLIRHGVFNPIFRFGCEDIELGFRLARYQLRVVYNRQAVSTMVRCMTLADICRRLVAQGQSNAVFSRLHPDPEVQRWTEVTRAVDAWRLVAAAYDAVIRAAEQLDTLARRKHDEGFKLENFEVAALHRAYWSACQAAKLKGISETLMKTEQR